MLPWIELDRAPVPGDVNQLRLKQRGQEFSIMLGSNELMNSRLSGSEEALADLSAARLTHVARPRVLIGGLGMGFTLRAALAVLPADAAVTVVELVPAVIAWARGPMAAIFNGCLEDDRVTIVEGDVGAVIWGTRSGFDAILLDVDNGPDGLTRTTNDSLYHHAGLRAAEAALSPGGVLAVWSCGPDAHFTRRLKDCGFATETVTVRANARRSGARHVIWLAAKRGSVARQASARLIT